MMTSIAGGALRTTARVMPAGKQDDVKRARSANVTATNEFQDINPLQLEIVFCIVLDFPTRHTGRTRRSGRCARPSSGNARNESGIPVMRDSIKAMRAVRDWPSLEQLGLPRRIGNGGALDMRERRQIVLAVTRVGQNLNNGNATHV